MSPSRSHRSSVRSSALILVALALLAGLSLAGSVRTASAQETGGSFGGSDFGSADGDSDGAHDSLGGCDYGIGDGSSRHARGSRPLGVGESLCLAVVAVLGVVQMVSAVAARREREAYRRQRAKDAPTCDVSTIRVALDHNARPALQAKLDALAKGGATATAAGRAIALHEVCVELRRNETSWLHAEVQNSPLAPIATVESAFHAAVADARSRYRIETVRASDGVVTEQADTATRDRGEGPGIVVVTIVVAARRAILDVPSADDADALTLLLLAVGSLSASEVMGLEVIWSPSAEDDRMTAEELARLYPEMRRIRDDTIAARLFCGCCGSPFSDVLARCPHCGAPAADARPRASA